MKETTRESSLNNLQWRIFSRESPLCSHNIVRIDLLAESFRESLSLSEFRVWIWLIGKRSSIWWCQFGTHSVTYDMPNCSTAGIRSMNTKAILSCLPVHRVLCVAFPVYLSLLVNSKRHSILTKYIQYFVLPFRPIFQDSHPQALLLYFANSLYFLDSRCAHDAMVVADAMELPWWKYLAPLIYHQ